MTLPEFLSRLDKVKTSGTGKYMALCPAHADTSPSLSVREGETVILVKCMSQGCSLTSICDALTLRLADLRYQSGPLDLAAYKKAMKVKRAADVKRRHAKAVIGKQIDARRNADYLLHSRAGLDISGWSDATLQRELHMLADAYRVLECEC